MWHNQLPDWLTTGVANGTISNAQLRDLLHKHITDEVTHFKGKIWQWDVANEFFAAWTHPLPTASTATTSGSRTWARASSPTRSAGRTQADPQALLFYNDYNIAGEDGTNAKSRRGVRWVKKLLAQGVPIDGVGDQGHLDTQYGFPTQHAARPPALRRPRPEGGHHRGRRPHVREQRHRPGADRQPGAVRPAVRVLQMLKACLAVQQLHLVHRLGLRDADSWVPGFFTGEGYATLYDVNLNPKPAYSALQQDLGWPPSAHPTRAHTRTPHP